MSGTIIVVKEYDGDGWRHDKLTLNEMGATWDGTPTITARANITSYNVGEGAYVGLAIDSYDGFDMVNGRMTVRFNFAIYKSNKINRVNYHIVAVGSVQSQSQ